MKLVQKISFAVILLTSAAFVGCSTADIMGEPFYSPKSKKLYNELIELSKKSSWTNLNEMVSEEMQKEYGIKKDANELYVDGTIKINEFYNDEELWYKGIKVGSRLNSVVKISIPLFLYTSLNEIEGIDYVEISSEDIGKF